METMKTGTTTVGIVCRDGVVIGADQQATMGSIASIKNIKKVFQITDNIAMTIAGTAGDGQALAKMIKAELNLYKMQNNIEGFVPVKVAANLLGTILRSGYKNSPRPDMVQLLIAGYDDEKGAQVFDTDITGGVYPIDDFSFSGSGSYMALGVLEDAYKKGCSVEEGVNVFVRALKSARKRDVYTGGDSLTIATITKDGLIWLPKEKVNELLKD